MRKNAAGPSPYTAPMPLVLSLELPAFLIGLLFGSFLNVCISRLPEHRSVVRPRSHCPRCGHGIRWYDNLPLLSWLLLRGHCRDCGAPVSWRYPAVEFATGLWFAAVTLLCLRDSLQGGGIALPAEQFASLILTGVGLTALGFLLLGLLVMDWQTHTLPDAFTLSGTLLGFLLICTQGIFLSTGEGDIKLSPRRNLRLSSPGSFVAKGNVFLTGTEKLVFGRLAAIVAAALLLLLIRWLYFALRGRKRVAARQQPLGAAEGDGRYGLGLGDVKLLAMIAAFLGFWPAILALFLGITLCSLYAVSLLLTRRATPLSRLPLGSFLCLGGLVAALAGDPLIRWYSSLLR